MAWQGHRGDPQNKKIQSEFLLRAPKLKLASQDTDIYKSI